MRLKLCEFEQATSKEKNFHGVCPLRPRACEYMPDQ